MKLRLETEIRQLKKIHQLAGIGYWAYRYTTKEMWWSEVTFSIFGYKTNSFSPTRSKLLKHIHPEDLLFFEESLKQMKSQAIEIEFRFYKNGELRLGKITGEVYHGDEPIEEVLFQDITDIKIKEFEIAKAWNKALEAENLKNAFLANMSHELRTPLNAIIGFSELLETGNADGNVEKFSNSIKNSGIHLLKIIENLLKVSMLESRTAKPVKRNFNLHNLLQEVEDNCTDSLKQQNKAHLSLKFCYSEANSLIIKSDQNKIASILKNLLHNAIKFTQEGSITCSYQVADQAIQFSVSDTGPGIPDKYKSSVFQRFKQADESGMHHSGTGLGLYISRLEIELLGGKIWIASENGYGTTVNFSIPNVIDQHNLDDISPTPEIYNWENYTVLIAEDQNSNYKILEAYLKRTNINIIWAKTGNEAIAACINNPEINIVLMDINMPYTNGLEATKLIKEKRPNLAIIAQTAYALDNDRKVAINAGCREHLPKPFNKADLLLLMARHLP